MRQTYIALRWEIMERLPDSAAVGGVAGICGVRALVAAIFFIATV